MFDSGIKQGVTFISTAFFYTLSLRFDECRMANVKRTLRS